MNELSHPGTGHLNGAAALRRETEAALVLAVVTLRFWIGLSTRLISARPASDVDQRDPRRSAEVPLADCGGDRTLGAWLAGEPDALSGRERSESTVLMGEWGGGFGGVVEAPLRGDAAVLSPDLSEVLEGLRLCARVSRLYGRERCCPPDDPRGETGETRPASGST